MPFRRNLYSRALTGLTPQDLSSLAMWYDPSDVSTLWKDTTGTSAVTAQWDSVARMDDKSGNGNNVTQATANVRPLWDGTNKLNFFWATNTTTRIALIKDASTTAIPRDDCSGGIIFDVLLNTNEPIFDLGTSQLAFSAGGVAPYYDLRVFNGVSYVASGLKFRARNNILTWRSNSSNLILNLNGSSANLTALSSASMTVATLASFNGGANDGGRIREIVVCSSDIGADKELGLRAYLGTKISTADSTKTVVVIGDSLSGGVGSEHGIRWYDYVTNRSGSVWHTVATDGGFIFAPVLTAANALNLKGSSEGIYHLWMGTNDINGGTKTGLQTAASLKAYSDTLRAGGAKVIVYTLQDFPNNEAERLACNAQIATDSASYDAIVDLAAITELSDCTNTTYFTSDQVHLMDAGYALVGAAGQAAQAAIP